MDVITTRNITRITVNNLSMKKEQAIKLAYEIHDETGTPVEVCDILGDTILYLYK